MEEYREIKTISKPVAKNIPLKNIIFIEGTNPRLEINESRVEFFIECFQNGKEHNVPFIKVLTIQTGDYRNIQYLILDGLHRYEAKKRLQEKEIQADIYVEPCFTLLDLDNKRARAEILKMACPYNADSSLPLTLTERKAAAYALDGMNYGIKEIAELVSVCTRTIERWQAERKRSEKMALKQEACKLLKAGKSLQDTSRIIDVPKSTLQGWKNELFLQKEPCGSTHGNGSELESGIGSESVRKPTDVVFRTSGAGELLPATKDEETVSLRPEDKSSVPEEGGEVVLDKLTKFCDDLRTTAWSEEADDFVVLYLLPLFEAKSEKLKKVISLKGYDELYEDAKSIYEEVCAQRDELKAELSKKQELIDKLQKELSGRENYCRFECAYSKEWITMQLENAIEFLLNNVKELDDAITEGSLTDFHKRSIHVPKDALPAFNQLLLNAVYVTIGQFEWAIRNEVRSQKIVNFFSNLINMIMKLGLHKRNDMTERINNLMQVMSLN